MSEDLDLTERFEPLATASFAPVTDPSVLGARVARRRRKRRVIVAAGVAAAVAVVGSLGVLAARAAPGGDGPVDELRTVAPTKAEQPSVPASYGTAPRLVIGIVPPALASEGCGPRLFGEGEIAACTLGQPATAETGDGIRVLLRPASPEVQAAWKQGDAAALAALHERDRVGFTTVGGRNVLALGETRSPGRNGGPERVSHAYELLIGDDVMEVFAEAVSDHDLGEVIRGLGVDPADLGFAISVDALPAGATAIAQGQERLWYQPDERDPSRSDDNGGAVAAITYAVGGESVPLVVHVVRDVDASSYIDSWAAQQEGFEPEVAPVTANGRSGLRVRMQLGGVAEEGGEGAGERIAVAVDDETVVIVDGKVSQHDTLAAIAGRTRVAEAAPSPAATSTTTAATTPPGQADDDGGAPADAGP